MENVESSSHVSVVLTAYNDEESIGLAVRDFISHPLVSDVSVIDNNSKDSTKEVALSAGAKVVSEPRQGYGFACIRGLEVGASTTSDLIALCEGDMTFRAYDLDKLVSYTNNADMVIGSRTTQELLAHGSQMDWFYVWGNLFLAKLVQLKFWNSKHWGRVRLTDVGCTFRVIRRSALLSIVDSLKVGGDCFSPHMVMVAISHGLKVVEVPITFHQRIGKSKGASSTRTRGVSVGLRMLWHIISY